MREAYLYTKSCPRSVQLVTSHENLVRNHQAFVVQVVAEMAPIQPFIMKVANRPGLLMLDIKKKETSDLPGNAHILDRSSKHSPTAEGYCTGGQRECYVDLQIL